MATPIKFGTDGWRSMVDCVMIDTDYDGKVFNMVFSDVPEKKPIWSKERTNCPSQRKAPPWQ